MAKKQLTESELTDLIYEATIAVLQEEEMNEWVKGAGLAANLGNAVGRGIENLKQFGRDFNTARKSGKAAAQLDNMKKNVTSDLYGDRTPEINMQKGRTSQYGTDRKAAVTSDNQQKYGNSITPNPDVTALQNNAPQGQDNTTAYNINTQMSPQQLLQSNETTCLRYLVGKGFNWDNNSQRWLYRDGKSYADESGYPDIKAAANRYKQLMMRRLSENITIDKIKNIVAESIKKINQ